MTHTIHLLVSNETDGTRHTACGRTLTWASYSTKSPREVTCMACKRSHHYAATQDARANTTGADGE